RQKTVNTIRVLAADTVQKANSGHPGAPMGMAAMAYALWMDQMTHNPKNPAWKNRDRFVLSSGHASALIYTMLHLTGYGLEMDDLKQFRQWGSKTPGHPEYRHTVGIETTTGPLGQGVANAVGFAIAETMMAAKFNRPGFPVVDHRTYAFCGDGCLMEGISAEAASLAGTLELGKLTLLYDDNEISIEGNTDIAFKEDVGKRFEAYGWQVIRLDDGNDAEKVAAALAEAKKDEKHPTLIICPTKIGFGCPAKEGSASSHGSPLGEENVLAAKKNLGMPEETFYVLPEVYAHIAECMDKNEKAEKAWDDMFAAYCEQYPELKAEWDVWHTEELPEDVVMNDELWQWDGKIATRATSGQMINRLAKLLPNLVGGSADLAPSNLTYIKEGGDYSAENRAGRNMHFGVREHAMAAICNAIALHGGLRVFCGTFFVFSDYMKHSMRMSAIMKLPVTYVLTHDSIGVGEDGATHEPIEHLAGLRATPDLLVLRPADGKETTAAWLTALTCGLPTALVLTRQNLPQYENSGCEAMKGGYILADSEKETPDILLMASGSEVEQIMGAKEELKKDDIDARVISMPCMKLFLQQSKEYQESVIPSSVRARVAMEAGTTMPWYRFVGLDGIVLGIDHYGASAPAGILFKEFGFTVENVVKAAKEVLAK
ncbi:MAG: transketolase, partial [Clostridia bacterium]|nr:transketolase [Clostridia bacterium]